LVACMECSAFISQAMPLAGDPDGVSRTPQEVLLAGVLCL
jgi:hypothetical protein